VISRGDGRVEVSLESPASAGLFRFRRARDVTANAAAVRGTGSGAARRAVGLGHARAGLKRQAR